MNIVKKKSVILIIDDDPIASNILKIQLETKSYQVSTLADGSQCEKIIAELAPDLIMMDYNMPTLNGIDSTKLIRKSFSAVELPIIMITNNDSESVVIQALEAGANDYVAKATPFTVIAARVAAQVGLKILAQQWVSKKEDDIIMQMIVTCNHEINNPLAVAFGSLPDSPAELTERQLLRLRESLERVKIIVQQISNMAKTREVIDYEFGLKMFKLK